jgi:hypothetical protein
VPNIKSFFVGILGAAGAGLVVFGDRVWLGVQWQSRTVHLTEIYYPAWIPYWGAQKGIDLWFHARANAGLPLVLFAFVVSFCWNHYSMRPSAAH